MDINGIEKTGIEAIVLRPQTFGEEYTIKKPSKIQTRRKQIPGI